MLSDFIDWWNTQVSFATTGPMTWGEFLSGFMFIWFVASFIYVVGAGIGQDKKHVRYASLSMLASPLAPVIVGLGVVVGAVGLIVAFVWVVWNAWLPDKEEANAV